MPEDSDLALSRLRHAIFPDCPPGVTVEQLEELAIQQRHRSMKMAKLDAILAASGLALTLTRRPIAE